MVRGGEVVGEECALQGGEGLLAKRTAGVETLVREGFEDGGPVCCPCYMVLVRLEFDEKKGKEEVPSVVSR
jgi:hypothetical protein